LLERLDFILGGCVGKSSLVVKDLRLKDKDKDFMSKDEDKDKDLHRH